MNTSQSKPSVPSSVNTERTALRLLFWRQGIMRSFRQRLGTSYQIAVAHTLSAVEFIQYAHGEEAVPDLIRHDHITFEIIGLDVGDEKWGAIIARRNSGPVLRIVDPFLIPDGDVSKIALFKEEC